MTQPVPHRVLISGGGVAGFEATKVVAPYLERADRGEGGEQPPHGSAAALILAEGDPVGGIELLLGR